MLIPISDDNEDGYRDWYNHPVHYFFIVLCFLVFGYEIYLVGDSGGDPQRLKYFIEQWSFNPRLYLGPDFLQASFGQRVVLLFTCLAHVENLGLLKMLSSTFLHGSPAHLFGNMLLLWMLGDNVEYAMGSVRYLVFFLLVGMLSEIGYTLLSDRGMPAIGASGAIMAVAGAYWIYFPRAEINFFYFLGLWWGVFAVPARIVLGFYFLADTAATYFEYNQHNYSGVAVGAHVSGFLAGMLLAWPFDDKPLYQPIARPHSRHSLVAKLQKTGDPWGTDKRD